MPHRGSQTGLSQECKPNVMRTVRQVFFFMIALTVPVVAQSSDAGTPPAARGPVYDVSAGYTYLAMPIANAGRVSLNGVDVSGHVEFNRHWGATVDSSYARNSNVLGTEHQGYVLSFLGGPVIYPVERGNSGVFVHALFGAGLVDGAVPVSVNTYFHGWQDRFSYALGGGFERSISGPFAIRVSGDYLRTSFYDSATAVQSQNNLRVTVGLVLRLNNRLHQGR